MSKKKPIQILSNLAISVDGKIATATREHFPLGTPLDRKTMVALRKKSDAVLFGASTLRAYKAPSGTADKIVWNIVVSRRLEGIEASWKFFTSGKIKRLLCVEAGTPREITDRFSSTSEIFFYQPGGVPVAQQIVQECVRRGIKKLVVEGGGAVMWDFVSQNLIDEYYVTLTPRLLGGTEAPTLVDGAGLAKDQVVNLKLKRARKVGDEIYLVYGRTEKRGA